MWSTSISVPSLYTIIERPFLWSFLWASGWGGGEHGPNISPSAGENYSLNFVTHWGNHPQIVSPKKEKVQEICSSKETQEMYQQNEAMLSDNQ